MGFPQQRLRRLRATPLLRQLVDETDIRPHHLVHPLFVVERATAKTEIPSMPGCFQWPLEELGDEAMRLREVGITSVILFGIPHSKDDLGTGAYLQDGVIPRAIHIIRTRVPDLIIWADVCLCEYTDHGHCGVLREGEVDNDATLPLLARTAVVYGQAGADIIAPSDMMDGRIGVIRRALDEAGMSMMPIVSYAAKYASGFYGPFRDAAMNAPRHGDRRTYQMSVANSDEALREVSLDIQEGADMVMVKPALSYLDVIHRVKRKFAVPVVAYSVSGEYAMVKAAAGRGWIDEDRIIAEMLLSMRRAGADIIVTYFAKDAARQLGGTK